MNGLQVSNKKLHELADKLAVEGLCNKQPLDFETWQKKRDKQGYTLIAYSKGKFGTICELYYCREDKDFALV